MRNYMQRGNSVTVAAPGAVESGDVVQVGSLIGVAYEDADIGDDVEIAIEGVYSLPKGAGEITAGASVYWSGTQVTTADTDDALGIAAETSDGDDIAVKLVPTV